MQEQRRRAGTLALSLLSVPINVLVLEGLMAGPKTSLQLRRIAGSPPQTTMRGHLRKLSDFGVIVRQRPQEVRGHLDIALTQSGRRLYEVAVALEGWLASAPEAAYAAGSPGAKSAVKALVEGWDSNIVRALAARSLTLTELDRLIATINYPSLERRLGAMRLTQLVEPVPGSGRGTPHRVTPWLRTAVGPLIASAQWERANQVEEAAALSPRDLEAAMLLALPMVRLAPDQDGSCRLAVEFRAPDRTRITGATVGVRGGAVVSCTAKLDSEATAWALGHPTAWLNAIVDEDVSALELGGDSELVRDVLEQLHRTLFATPEASLVRR